MNSSAGRATGSVFYGTHSTRSLVITLLLSVAIIICVIASLAIGYRSGFDIGPEAAGNCLRDCAEGQHLEVSLGEREG